MTYGRSPIPQQADITIIGHNRRAARVSEERTMFAAKQAQLSRRPVCRRVENVCMDWLIECPICSKPMQASQLAPGPSGAPELQTFKCDSCSVAITSETVLSRY